MRTGHLRYFEDALRADNNFGQVEFHVRKRAEKSRVKLARALVAFPAMARGDNFINTIWSESVDQSLQIASIFGFGMIDPKLADRVVKLGRDRQAESFLNGCCGHVGQRVTGITFRVEVEFLVAS